MDAEEESVDKVCVIRRDDAVCRRRVLMGRIEDAIGHLIDCLVRNEKPSLTYGTGMKRWHESGDDVAETVRSEKSQSTSRGEDEDEDDVEEDIEESQSEKSPGNSFDLKCMVDCEPIRDSTGNGRPKTIRFSALASRKRFAIIMKVLSHVHANLTKYKSEFSGEFYITKRAFYYALKNQDVKRFVKKQSQIDRAINEVTLILDCAPWEIGFISTSKGLVAGDLSLDLADGQVINYRASGCQAVPDVIQNVTLIRTNADYVLVVEKDSAFQRLMREGCPAFNNCILITGKGYPDVQTRMLVRLLSEKMDMPVYALVDPDPHGFEIMCIYRFGTLNNLGYREQLICPKMRWLGIHQVDLLRLGVQRVKLTHRDSKKIDDLLHRVYVTAEFSKHLKQMKLGKAEIESVDKPGKHFLSEHFIPNKIRMKEYY